MTNTPNIPEQKRSLAAFTLIELLVVIAIIAILASMILPAVGRSIEAARSSSCLNNQHQMAVGAMNYSLDQKGRFPNFRSWLWTTPTNIASGELYRYVGNRATYLCPTDKREIRDQMTKRKLPAWTTGQAPAGRGTSANAVRDYSYAMSCGMCHAIETSLYRNPSKTMLYMEPYLATNDFSGEVGPRFNAHSLALRHGKSGNLIMTDLHMERPSQKKEDNAEKYKIFWFPTEKSDGPNNMGDFAAGLLPGW